MVERNQERLKLDNGAVVEVYTTPRRRKQYTCRVTRPDGSQTRQGGFGAMTFAWEWGIEQGKRIEEK